VLTNRHVIKDASPERIKITLADGRNTHAHSDQVWVHRETDVAVMGIDMPDLVAARMGDSDKMEIGDFVLTVGSPFGLSHSVTYGIISAKGRRHLDLDPSEIPLQNFIQTDAAINPGNSGGPLINLRGEVVGINCAIASPTGSNSGVGFAIPINLVMTVARQLVASGGVRWAYLGVNLDPAFGSMTAAELGLPRLTGALVKNVISDSPAEAAGLRSNDVIVQVGETAIDDDDHLVDVIKMTEVGKETLMVIFRDRRPMAVKVAVAQKEEDPPKVSDASR
jgi:serine protease Do